MNDVAAIGMTRAVPESFDKSLSLVRRLLSAAGLGIVQEFDLSREAYLQPGSAGQSCVVLLVDTPLLLFEGIALDRGAAVFLPLHVVITGDRDTSCVHWVNPVAGSGLRPPAPAKHAIEDLYRRVTEALAELPHALDDSLQVRSA